MEGADHRYVSFLLQTHDTNPFAGNLFHISFPDSGKSLSTAPDRAHTRSVKRTRARCPPQNRHSRGESARYVRRFLSAGFSPKISQRVSRTLCLPIRQRCVAHGSSQAAGNQIRNPYAPARNRRWPQGSRTSRRNHSAARTAERRARVLFWPDGQ